MTSSLSSVAEDADSLSSVVKLDRSLEIIVDWLVWVVGHLNVGGTVAQNMPRSYFF